MGVVNPVRAWRDYSKPQRSELYLRWSLYLMALAPLPLSLLINSADPDLRAHPASRVAMVVGLAQTLLSLRAYRTSLDHYLKRPSDHLRWLALNGGVAVAGSWAVLLLGPRVGTDPVVFTFPIASTLLFSAFGPASVGLPPRRAALAGTAGLLAVLPAMLLVGAAPGTAVAALCGTALVMFLVGSSCRSFAWLQSVVWELDTAREAQARLAVAEERLRFSRDLHDVMGRNLTTIALKSELAVQLARRGRPEAADQMAEVQQIAQESQREVRDVVRGYRTADLHAEAIGARAVLRSADVLCEIDLGEDADRLPAPVQSVLGWVIREATTNVLRHSEAGRCAIRLRREDDRAVLELENDGVPAVPLPSQGSGTGLRGLRERLAAHDGELALPDAGPGGFRLIASVPLRGAGNAPAPRS
ncbi:sensor histidine kinase [Kitasatospora sp. NPDC057541]|uniref:sensor histidine kinase n=1 Tax=unclassified Kitasatospora TaxID=2633591 RepID=UPI003683EB6B